MYSYSYSPTRASRRCNPMRQAVVELLGLGDDCRPRELDALGRLADFEFHSRGWQAVERIEPAGKGIEQALLVLPIGEWIESRLRDEGRRATKKITPISKGPGKFIICIMAV